MSAGYEIGRDGLFGSSVPLVPPAPVVDRSHSFNPAHQPEPGRRFAFTGAGGDFAVMLLRGAILALPTFGFYRFWLFTDLRRHLWSNTVVEGERFEYTGTARELLVGFLMAMAILAPVYLGYFILGLVAERAQAFASMPLVAILYVFGQYAVFRARRYRLTRTTFRGLRFWMEGSAWGYAGRAALWDALTVLTLGAAYPWRTAALERYKMRCSRYGNLAGDFTGSGGELMRAGFWMLPAFGALCLFVVAAAVGTGGTNGKAIAGLLPLVFLVGGLALPWLMAAQARWALNGLRFGPVGLVSRLRPGQIYGCYIKLVALSTVALGLFGAFAAAVLFAILPKDINSSNLVIAYQFWATLGLLMMAYLLLMTGLRRYFLLRGIWVAAAGTTALLNAKALDEVLAAGRAESSVGEGLADALDLGAF